MTSQLWASQKFAMACPLCGDRCNCSATGSGFAGEHTAVLIDPDSNEPNYSSDVSEQQFTASLEAPAARANLLVAVGQNNTTSADQSFYRPAGDADGATWRDEISHRVQAHRARRRRRFDPDASLAFGFEPETMAGSHVQVPDEMAARPAETPATKAPRMYRRIALEMAASEASMDHALPAEVAPETNVIEFPRAVTQDLFADELAEPMLDSPRILDVPDEPMPAPPVAAAASLSSLRLDENIDDATEQLKEIPAWISNYRDEYDEAELELPLQVAPMHSRAVSAVIDVALVLTATAVFCVIVLSITKYMPQGKEAFLVAIGISATFYLAYHYAFLVFSGLTPGMQVAQLELCSFEGCYPLRRMRGARAWAMGVSCMSLGMGFAWAAVDEDGLGWHDRITRTYLRQS